MTALETLKSRIGQTVTSGWTRLDQDRISAFADITEDHNFFHIDPERAKAETPFGGTIAHGFLTLSMLSKMAFEALPELPKGAIAINYGFDKVRFLAPVPSGSRIRGHLTLTDLIDKGPGQIQAIYSVEVEIENHDKPALAAEWLSRIMIA